STRRTRARARPRRSAPSGSATLAVCRRRRRCAGRSTARTPRQRTAIGASASVTPVTATCYDRMTGAMTSWDFGGRRSTYDRFPVAGGGRADACVVGWADVSARLRAGDPRVVVVDCYPGVLDQDVKALAAALGPDVVIDVATGLKPPGVIDAMVEPDLGDDPVFGRLTRLHLADFFDDRRLVELRRRVEDAT